MIHSVRHRPTTRIPNRAAEELIRYWYLMSGAFALSVRRKKHEDTKLVDKTVVLTHEKNLIVYHKPLQ